MAIVLALITKSVWALVFGALAENVVRLAITHYYGRHAPARFAWDREVLRSLRRFGSWIFLSSAVTFAAQQGDRLVLGSLLTTHQLGVYAVAITLSSAVTDVVGTLSGRVLFPLYSMVGKLTNDDLRRRVRKIRTALAALSLPPVLVLIVAGDVIVHTVWDVRYVDAGWMVQILAMGGCVALIGQIGPIELARGESWIGAVVMGVSAAALVPCLVGGFRMGGEVGIIIGVAITKALDYPLRVWIARRYGIWLHWLDLSLFAISAAVVALGFFVRHALGFPPVW